MAVTRISIETERIELAAFLKWAQAADTGGQAKMLIQTGRVKVNGRVERRRGRTLVPGDRVELGAHALEIVRA
ncbi:MAG TPA: RNA-binding S4 domain-containing protein [bacterium]|nr:RNA-binding S4 domain-containing protein [bacterium]